MMCAFNRIGGVPAGANYDLFVKLLEDEWGFDGIAVTDYYEGSSWGWPGNMVVRCHMFPMGDYSGERNSARRIDGVWDAEKSRPTVDGEARDALYYAVRTTAQRMLKAVANSNADLLDNTVFADRTYNVVLGSVGYISFSGEYDIERDIDILKVIGSNEDATECNPFTGVTFYMPSGDFVGDYFTVGKHEFDLNITLNADKWGQYKGTTGRSKVTFNVLPAFKLAEEALTGKVDKEYSSRIEFIEYDESEIDGGGMPRGKKWYKCEGLPAGLTLNEDGTITGVPKEDGTFEVTAYYDSWGGTGTKWTYSFTLEIAEKDIIRTEFKTEDGKLWYKHSDQGDDAWRVVIDLGEFKGDKGDAGAAPTISEDGYWIINGEKTEFKATGDKGDTPAITISEDGYWVIDGVKTDVKAVGEKGENGESKSGCNGSLDIVSVSVASAAFVAVGAVIYIIRRKKKN